MTRFQKTFICFLFLMVLLQGCRKENLCDCVKGTGESIKQTRTTGAFHALEVHDRIDVEVIQDSSETAIVEAGKNIAGLVQIKNEGGTLVLTDLNRCNWVRSYKKRIKVSVHCIQLQAIHAKGSGDITTASTLSGDSLSLNVWSSGSIQMQLQTRAIYAGIHTGTGDILLKGSSSKSCLYAAGNGWMKCGDLYSDYIYIRSKNTGKSYVYATGTLDAEVLGSGDVYYSGNPQVVNLRLLGKGGCYPN